MLLGYWIFMIALWFGFGLAKVKDAPWWIEYPLFGVASIITAVVVLAMLLAENVGPRW